MIRRWHWQGHNDWSSRRHDVAWLHIRTDSIGGHTLTVMLLGFGAEVTWLRKREQWTVPADWKPYYPPRSITAVYGLDDVPVESLGREKAP